MADRLRKRTLFLGAVLILVVIAAFVAVVEDGAVRELARRVDRALTGGAIRRYVMDDPRVRPSDLDVPPPAPGAYAWAEGSSFVTIAHGLGADSATSRNALAAFRRARRLGFRLFEVDLSLTTDGRLVCYHGEAGEPLDELSYQVYLERMRALGRQPCDLEELVALVAADPEVFFILDVKNRFEDAYALARRVIGNPALGRRFVPQVYHFGQVAGLRRDRFFGGLIFTAYRSSLSPEEIFEYARRARVGVVTIPVRTLEAWTGVLPADPLVLTHPVNDIARATVLRRRGVDGIYTSALSPEMP